MVFGSGTRVSSLIFSSAAMLVLLSTGCKQRTDSADSGLRDATTPAAAPTAPGPKCSPGEQVDALQIAGVGYVGTAFGGNNQLAFRKIDRSSRDACATVARSIPYSGFSDIEITVPSGTKIKLQANPGQNYSYFTQQANCDEAMQILGMTTGFTAGENCSVQLDTEDQYWFGVTVRPASMSANLGYDATVDGGNAAFLAQYSAPSSVAAPLLPMQQINAKVDPAVKTEMLRLHDQFQMNSSDPAESHKERNSCLRNARANSWIDLQAHYYCIMPYEPHRKCYSTDLVTKTEALKKARETGAVQITDIQYALKVREFMGEALDSCRTKNGFKDFSDSQIGIFKYVMFTIGGVMDFNVDGENALLKEFYSEIKRTDNQTPDRPSRITDPIPWRAEQKRYADARATQAPRVKLGLAKRGCATSGGTWDDATRACACPAGKAFSPQKLSCE